MSPLSGQFSASLDPPALGPLSYLEWRITLVNQARKAGMGDVGRPLNWFIWEDDDESRLKPYLDLVGKRKAGASGGRLKRDTSRTIASGSDDRDTLWEYKLAELVDDSEYVTDDEELSDIEWKGWMGDLDRQIQVEQFHRLDTTSRGNEGIFWPSLSLSSTEPVRHHYSNSLATTSSYESSMTSTDRSLQISGDALSPFVLPRRRRMASITSTVSAGTEAIPSQQCSSNVTAESMGSRLLRKKGSQLSSFSSSSSSSAMSWMAEAKNLLDNRESVLARTRKARPRKARSFSSSPPSPAAAGSTSSPSPRGLFQYASNIEASRSNFNDVQGDQVNVVSNHGKYYQYFSVMDDAECVSVIRIIKLKISSFVKLLKGVILTNLKGILLKIPLDQVVLIVSLVLIRRRQFNLIVLSKNSLQLKSPAS